MKRTRLLGSVIATLLLMGFAYGPKVLVKVVDTNGDAVAGAIVTITDASGSVLAAAAEANNGGVYTVDLGGADAPLHVQAESPDGTLKGEATAEFFKKGKGTTVIRVVVEPYEEPEDPGVPVPEFHLGQFTINFYPADGIPQANYSLTIFEPAAYLMATDRLRFLPSGETTGMLQDGVFLSPGTSIWFWGPNAVIGGLSATAYLDGFNGIEVLNTDGSVRLRLLP